MGYRSISAILLLSFGTVGACFLLASPERNPASPTVPDAPRVSHVPAPELLALQSPQPPYYRVEPMPVRGKITPRSEQDDILFAEAAELIQSQYFIPQERLEFFAWMDHPESPMKHIGWDAFVSTVAETPQGTHVTIWVSARAAGGAVLNRFVEEYLWSGNRLTYLRGYCHPEYSPEPSFMW